MTWLTWLEFLYYVTTIIGLPGAVLFFVYQQRRARRNEEQAIYQSLMDQYTSFMTLLLDHQDLGLLRPATPQQKLTDEQKERKLILLDILISVLERAFVLLYKERMDRRTQRLLTPWEEHIRQWCRRDDFRAALPELLEGTDEKFRTYVQQVAESEEKRQQASTCKARLKTDKKSTTKGVSTDSR